MIKARIKILSRGDGWSQRLEQPCEVETGAATKILYSDNGDDCALFIGGDGVKMTRRGSVRLEMLFKQGEKTFCKIGLGGGSCGETDCFTSLVNVTRGAGGISLKLKYSLGGSEISLSAFVVYNRL